MSISVFTFSGKFNLVVRFPSVVLLSVITNGVYLWDRGM